MTENRQDELALAPALSSCKFFHIGDMRAIGCCECRDGIQIVSDPFTRNTGSSSVREGTVVIDRAGVRR